MPTQKFFLNSYIPRNY